MTKQEKTNQSERSPAAEPQRRRELAPAPAEPGIPPQVLWTVGGLAGVVALVVLAERVSPRLLLALTPELVVLSVCGALIYWCYRMFRYRDLSIVVSEYKPLLATLRERQRPTYVALIDRAMANIMVARDRAEVMRELLRTEDLPAFERRVAELEQRATAQDATEEDRAACTQSLQETREALANLQRLHDYVTRYEQSKEHLAQHFKNLRVKLQTMALDPLAGDSQSAGASELDAIVRDIETLEAIYDRVDGRGDEKTEQ